MTFGNFATQLGTSSLIYFFPRVFFASEWEMQSNA
jgi:hypothetical protein